jgi:hypothetical protein
LLPSFFLRLLFLSFYFYSFLYSLIYLYNPYCLSVYLLLPPFSLVFLSSRPSFCFCLVFISATLSLFLSTLHWIYEFHEPKTPDGRQILICILRTAVSWTGVRVVYYWINSVSCMRDCSYINTRYYVEWRDRQLSALSHVRHLTIRGHHVRSRFLPALCSGGKTSGQEDRTSSLRKSVWMYFLFYNLVLWSRKLKFEIKLW